jgi:hypothetical protein
VEERLQRRLVCVCCGMTGSGAQVKINDLSVRKPLERRGSDLSSRYMACVFVRH